jgi:hypothetical protein
MSPYEDMGVIGGTPTSIGGARGHRMKNEKNFYRSERGKIGFEKH